MNINIANVTLLGGSCGRSQPPLLSTSIGGDMAIRTDASVLARTDDETMA